MLALLAIFALLIASSLGGFFRGRVLNFEARRMLTLVQYGQSRAVAEGVPVVLWVDPTRNAYGLAVLGSFADADGDTRAVAYTMEPGLAFETPPADTTLVSEADDEKLGLPEGVLAIRCNPDGFFDEGSAQRITIRLGDQGALDLVPTANRLAYEIREGSPAR